MHANARLETLEGRLLLAATNAGQIFLDQGTLHVRGGSARPNTIVVSRFGDTVSASVQVTGGAPGKRNVQRYFDANEVSRVRVLGGARNDAIDVSNLARTTFSSGVLPSGFSVAPSPFGERVIPAQVDAGAGHDTVLSGDGNDTLWGGSGNDRLSAGGGNDRLEGESGRDTLLGGGGADLLDGGSGNDHLEGDAGTDDLRGGPGRDTLLGGGGPDRLRWAELARGEPTDVDELTDRILGQPAGSGDDLFGRDDDFLFVSFGGGGGGMTSVLWPTTWNGFTFAGQF